MSGTPREVGWVITKESLPTTNLRVGWGQMRVHAAETESSYDKVIGRTIFMDKSLTEHMMPEDIQVIWRAFDDDNEMMYEGIVRFDWLFGDDDLAYNIQRFCETDVGATVVLFLIDGTWKQIYG